MAKLWRDGVKERSRSITGSACIFENTYFRVLISVKHALATGQRYCRLDGKRWPRSLHLAMRRGTDPHVPQNDSDCWSGAAVRLALIATSAVATSTSTSQLPAFNRQRPANYLLSDRYLRKLQNSRLLLYQIAAMSTRGQFNTKNPTIKRILKEASELSVSPSPDYHAEPLEDNIFEWHFTIKGPESPSAYAGGIYHGRIILPPQYPLRPPNFRFLTPTGRFEVNREICLSISGHHEETWQPAWGVRTALVAIRSFMDTDAKGQLGGIECSRDARERMARDSGKWACSGCGKSNTDIMKECEEAVKDIEETEGKRKEEQVPEELRLAYRDELGQKEDAGAEKIDKGKGKAVESEARHEESIRPPALAAPADTPPTITPSLPAVIAPRPTRTVLAPPLQQLVGQSADRSLSWIDTCIWGVVAALLFMIIKKFDIL
ncbi:UBC-like protein [Didymella exigua CBS 183.55]|uniref:UBC-like protein n=1 Tax=Didymella exigua CBS 183.55 TaxID=1150837 RepID=A0A6A5RKN6_9PLEO|nr:UBC-like protein [Didymella exigua CBS 183.55]KAF1927534.1 UBC-like protein [Didymella exigua CBS 183.55]